MVVVKLTGDVKVKLTPCHGSPVGFPTNLSTCVVFVPVPVSTKGAGKLPKAAPLNSKVGEFFDKNSSLIDKIIKKYATSTMKTGRVVKEAEDGGMSSADFKSANIKSKEAAKEALPELIQQLVDELKKVKADDYNAYVKVLNDLDKYKFTPTNTKNVLKQLLRALDEPTMPTIAAKKKKSDDDELKALGIDDEPINIDDEEEI